MSAAALGEELAQPAAQEISAIDASALKLNGAYTCVCTLRLIAWLSVPSMTAY